MHPYIRQTDERTDGRTDGRMDGRMDRQTHRQTGRQTHRQTDRALVLSYRQALVLSYLKYNKIYEQNLKSNGMIVTFAISFCSSVFQLHQTNKYITLDWVVETKLKINENFHISIT